MSTCGNCGGPTWASDICERCELGAREAEAMTTPPQDAPDELTASEPERLQGLTDTCRSEKHSIVVSTDTMDRLIAMARAGLQGGSLERREYGLAVWPARVASPPTPPAGGR